MGDTCSGEGIFLLLFPQNPKGTVKNHGQKSGKKGIYATKEWDRLGPLNRAGWTPSRKQADEWSGAGS